MAQKTWFITGTSRGFGREWAIAALERGDKVAATARDTSVLDDLVPKYGDACCRSSWTSPTAPPTSPPSQQAHEHLGRLDIVVNNAGLRALRLRGGAQRAGRPGPAGDQPVRRAVGDPGGAAVPAGAGQRAHHPGLLHRRDLRVPDVGAYHASKWGLEGLSQALAQEVKPLRHPRHAGRAGRVRHRLGGPVGQDSAQLRPTTRSARWPPKERAKRVSCAGRAAATREAILPSSTPSSRRCGSSWARRRWVSRPPTTSPGWRPGANGSRCPPRPRGPTEPPGQWLQARPGEVYTSPGPSHLPSRGTE